MRSVPAPNFAYLKVPNVILHPFFPFQEEMRGEIIVEWSIFTFHASVFA